MPISKQASKQTNKKKIKKIGNNNNNNNVARLDWPLKHGSLSLPDFSVS
jgi:hypothetical protein